MTKTITFIGGFTLLSDPLAPPCKLRLYRVNIHLPSPLLSLSF
jgi:hypothetical protein